MKDHLLSNLISKAGRRNLKDICREFDRCSRIYPALYHQRMIPWSEKGRVGISLSQWEAFQCAESPQLDEKIWCQWDEPSCENDYLGQWYNDGEGLAEFEDLSESVAMVISQEVLDFDQYEIDLEIRSGSDWLPLLHDWAFKYQMPLLRSDMSLWGNEDYDIDEFFELAEQWETLEDGTSIPRHPVVWRLIDNVFTSSMTALRAILCSDTVVTTNEPWPLCRVGVGSSSPINEFPLWATAEQSPPSDDQSHKGNSTSEVEAVSDGIDTDSQVNAAGLSIDKTDSQEIDEVRVSCTSHQLIEEELFWSIKCADSERRFRFKTLIGFEYLAKLLRSPDIRFNPLEVSETQGRKPLKFGAAVTRCGEDERNEAASLLPNSNVLGGNAFLMDSEADRSIRNEYMRLLEDYSKVDHPDHEDAEEAKDLENKLKAFKKHFVSDHDKYGNIRLFPKPDWEKPRKAVSNAINRTLDVIRKKSVEVAEQLDSQIDRKNGFCFRPNLKLPNWDVIVSES